MRFVPLPHYPMHRIAANTIGAQYLAGNLTESMRHMTACEYMVGMKGGFETLGLDGFLAELITWFREELQAAMKDNSFVRVGAY